MIRSAAIACTAAERLGHTVCTILSTPAIGGFERMAPLCALP
ncbi:hypothetical protein [Tsukamurella spumae]|nr:hypothetical protein [Tsukamurella spumae]